MAKDVIIEIGLEELPARFIDDAEKQFLDNTVKALTELRISYESITSFSTPRRLAVQINDVAEFQTTIEEEAGSTGVKAVAAKDDITVINIKSTRMLLAYGFLRKIFEVFEKYRTSIDMVTTSEVAVSVTVDNASHLDAIIKELEVFLNDQLTTQCGPPRSYRCGTDYIPPR